MEPINGVAFKDPDSGGRSQVASSTLAANFDTFLALLTTQLQNQDPLDPMKSEQFTTQLVQFAGVEQSINTNKNLEQLIELQTSVQLNSAVSYIGKIVEVVADELMLDGGAAKISYGLDHNAETTIITIVDLNGNAVRTVNGEIAAALNRAEFEIDQCPVSAKSLAGLIARLADNTLSTKMARQVFEGIWKGEGSADEIIEKRGLRQISDSSAIEKIVDEVLAANSQRVADYLGGKQKAFNALVGEVMKASKGKANPAQVNEILKQKLANR